MHNGLAFHVRKKGSSNKIYICMFTNEKNDKKKLIKLITYRIECKLDRKIGECKQDYFIFSSPKHK